jgi:hypothetical protein
LQFSLYPLVLNWFNRLFSSSRLFPEKFQLGIVGQRFIPSFLG